MHAFDAKSDAAMAGVGFATLLDAANDLIFIATPDGTLRFLNRAAREKLGLAPGSAVTGALLDVFAAEDRDRLHNVITQLRSGTSPTRQVEAMLASPAGPPLPVEGKFVLQARETSHLLAGVFRAAPSRATDGPAAHDQPNEQQILRNATRERELNELKAHFISMSSHELRTPLAALSLGVDFLGKYWPKLSTEQINKNLKTIDATVHQLRAVLDNVLIVSREDEGRLQCNRSVVELTAFARKLAEEIAVADQHRHCIDVRCARDRLEACVDPQLLRHILTNLVSNACKYSPAGSAVDLSLAFADGSTVIQIADQGIGIPLEDQSRLFALFFRASNVGTVTGTGLGLVVARRCVEAHQGRITLESTPGRGTTFTVTIPDTPRR